MVRHTVELAERFATEGFVTVAPDFYADVWLTGEEERLPTPQTTTSCGTSTPRSATFGPCRSCGRPHPVAVVGSAAAAAA